MNKIILTILIIVIIFIGYNYFFSDSTVRNFSKSINFSNKSSEIFNSGEIITDISIMEKIVTLKKKALEKASAVDIEKLNNQSNNFGNHYRDEFIRGLKLFIEGYENQDNDMFLEGQILLDQWSNWYNENLDEIRG